jgi:cysteine desulfurase/selenocysteine lyase
MSGLAIDRDGFFDLGELEKLAKKGRLLALSHALYNTGAIMPLEEAGKIANENNLLYCIDAAQTAGSIKVDVKKIGCHFLAFPGFKWLCGPMGIGVFYCSKKAAEMLSPPAIGGESATFSGDTIAYMDMPRRLQAGFRNYPGAAGLVSALLYILRVKIDNVMAMNIKVANALREELGRIKGVELHGPADEGRRTSIVTFTVPKDPEYIVRKLEEVGIVLAERDAGFAKIIRAAPHFFNTEEEAATVAARIRELL